MAFYSSIFITPSIHKYHCFSPVKNSKNRRRETKRIGGLILTSAASNENVDSKQTKLVTFLGKGGSGKTTASIFAAQLYAILGLKTCLVVQSQDPTPEYLLNCKIGPSPVKCNDNLSAVRLETTKMMLGPLKQLNQADARLTMTQGVLEGVVGEELGILPGMDSIFAALELERLVGVIDGIAKRNDNQDKFDMVVFDGISTEETLRMIGATGKLGLYLKYLRNLAEKTDLGRVASPSILRLVDEALSLGGGGINLNGKTSSDIWDNLEQKIKKGSSFFSEPQNFFCYIVMDPANALSQKSALRYWGCAIQAGINISGAFWKSPPNSSSMALSESAEVDFSPLPFASIPHLDLHNHQNWNEIVVREHSKDAVDLLSKTVYESSQFAVKFDPSNRSVALFMPGFDKSEIKLYQFRGGSELLVDAGDQRRVICLPSQIQGKVGGAKFIDRSLIITMR